MVPVPDGSRPAAIQISAELGLPYREGLVKNRWAALPAASRHYTSRCKHEMWRLLAADPRLTKLPGMCPVVPC